MVSYRLTWYCGYVAISCQSAMKFWCFSSCPFLGYCQRFICHYLLELTFWLMLVLLLLEFCVGGVVCYGLMVVVKVAWAWCCMSDLRSWQLLENMCNNTVLFGDKVRHMSCAVRFLVYSSGVQELGLHLWGKCKEPFRLLKLLNLGRIVFHYVRI